MVHSTQRGQESGEGRRIQSQTQNPTENDLSDQKKLTFSQGCGVPNCDCKCKKSD